MIVIGVLGEIKQLTQMDDKEKKDKKLLEGCSCFLIGIFFFILTLITVLAGYYIMWSFSNFD